MSQWKQEHNDRARARLAKALPAVFPAQVLIHAHARALVPPLPRLAVESYWRAHPVRADRLARALARRSGAPPEWAWTLSEDPDDGRPKTFRIPPAPYRERDRKLAAGQCCLCGQPVYRFGWHKDLWGEGRTNARASWHACCVAAWKIWQAPADQLRVMRKVQKRKCAETGLRLLGPAEVDHRVPLFQVWREHRSRPWADLLAFWGFPNLQAINRAAHVAKCATEAGDRARLRATAPVDRAPT